MKLDYSDYMKLDDLISELSKIRERSGNVRVVCSGRHGSYGVDRVSLRGHTRGDGNTFTAATVEFGDAS